MVLPPGLRDAFVAAKWLTDRGCPAIEQEALARLIANGAFERHLRQTAKALKARRSTLITALQRYAGDAVEVADSSAGHACAGMAATAEPYAQTRDWSNARATRVASLYLIEPYCLKPLPHPGLLLGYADLLAGGSAGGDASVRRMLARTLVLAWRTRRHLMPHRSAATSAVRPLVTELIDLVQLLCAFELTRRDIGSGDQTRATVAPLFLDTVQRGIRQFQRERPVVFLAQFCAGRIH